MFATPAETDLLHRLEEPGSTVRSVAYDLGITEHNAKYRLRTLYDRIERQTGRRPQNVHQAGAILRALSNV